MKCHHFTFILLADLVRFDQRNLAVRAEHILQFLVGIDLDRTLPIEDIEIGRYTADALFTSLLMMLKTALPSSLSPWPQLGHQQLR